MKIVLMLSILCGVLSFQSTSWADALVAKKAYQWTFLMNGKPSIACLEVQIPSGQIVREVVGVARSRLCPIPPKPMTFWTYIYLRDQSGVEKCAELDFNGQIRRMAPLNLCEPSKRLESLE